MLSDRNGEKACSTTDRSEEQVARTQDKQDSTSLEEKIQETLQLDALFTGVQEALNKGEKDHLLSIANKDFDKCNICELKKPKTQPWIDHNISENHISALIRQKGFGKAVSNLNKNCKFLRIKCELCGTWFGNPVLYQAHKYHAEHQLRVSDVLKWVKEAKNRGIARATWNKISKPERITAKQISDGLKALKKSN